MAGTISFTCSRCNKVHEGLPAIAFDAPSHYYGLSEDERASRAKLNQDLCVIDGEEGRVFYVRAVLEIPIIGHTETLEWGTWGSLSEQSFESYVQSFDDLDQSKLGALFSWFASCLPGYPSTLGLRSRIVPRDDRQRPHVEFDPTQDHPLVLDKINGIDLERAIEFVMPVLHKH